jgi:hypothetical protein
VKASACNLCQKQFGFFRRMHVCSVCNQQVCGGCSTGQLVRRTIRRVITQRVCKKCAVRRRNETAIADAIVAGTSGGGGGGGGAGR